MYFITRKKTTSDDCDIRLFFRITQPKSIGSFCKNKRFLNEISHPFSRGDPDKRNFLKKMKRHRILLSVPLWNQQAFVIKIVISENGIIQLCLFQQLLLSCKHLVCTDFDHESNTCVEVLHLHFCTGDVMCPRLQLF